MPTHGRIGIPHDSKPKEAFNSLDMFAQLTTLTTPSAGNDAYLLESGTDKYLLEDGSGVYLIE